jgi:bifunctional polynucleotide phosphatase/kinase
MKKTIKAINDFFKPMSQRGSSTDPFKWSVVEQTVLHGKYHAKSDSSQLPTKRRKIAAFDYDSTLVEKAKGKSKKVETASWIWWHRVVPKTLKELHENE